MRLPVSLFVVLFSAFVANAQPKAVKDALGSVAGVLTSRNGTIKAIGTAVFVDNSGELLASSVIFNGADSAVVIDNSGKVHPVRYIVGVNDVFGRSGPAKELISYYGLDGASIAQKAKEAIALKK